MYAYDTRIDIRARYGKRLENIPAELMAEEQAHDIDLSFKKSV